jgi:ATP synthase protein I
MAGAENKSGPEPSDRDAGEIRRRLDALGDKLAEAKERRRPAPTPQPQSQGRALGQAMRLGVELVAGVAVGGFIGWALDRGFGTAPFLLGLFIFLGAAAGILGVVRTAKQMQAEAPQAKDLPSLPDDDDD